MPNQDEIDEVRFEEDAEYSGRNRPEISDEQILRWRSLSRGSDEYRREAVKWFQDVVGNPGQPPGYVTTRAGSLSNIISHDTL